MDDTAPIPISWVRRLVAAQRVRAGVYAGVRVTCRYDIFRSYKKTTSVHIEAKALHLGPSVPYVCFVSERNTASRSHSGRGAVLSLVLAKTGGCVLM